MTATLRKRAMKATAAALVCIASTQLGALPRPPEVPRGAYSATVTHDAAFFVFPLPARAVWQWNLRATSESSLEYAWVVEVEVPDGHYEFGFLRFKYPGSQPREGGFAELIRSGQASVGKSESGKTHLVNDGRVRLLYEDDRLVVVVEDPRTFALLFSERPSQVSFRTVMPGEPAAKRTEPVTYDDR